MISKSVDFKEVHLSIPDFIDNESFEYLLEQFDIERDDVNDYQGITLTVTKVEVK